MDSVDGSERVLGTFELRGKLGRGAMAVVWRAYDTSLDREVAIKEPSLPPGGDDDVRAEFARRFVREARAAARLNHPGIVTIHSASLDEGRPLIVMELVEGSTLRHILDAQRLTAAQTYALFEQLLAATAYAHERGVVHRDLKPDNVFVTPGGTVKLADFGIAHLGDAGTTLTTAGSILGTPAYMAPEQIRGEPVDARADVFALGVMAYECLAGRSPFSSDPSAHYAAIFHRILDEPVPPLEPADPAAAPLVGVVLRALQKDRDERFESAAEMLATWRAAFPEHVDGRAELSGLSSIPVRSAPAQATEVQTSAEAEVAETRAHADAATQLAAPDASVAPAGGVPEPDGAARARSRRRFLIALGVAACVAVIAVGALLANDRWGSSSDGSGTSASSSPVVRHASSPSPSPTSSLTVYASMRDYLLRVRDLLEVASAGNAFIAEAFDSGKPRADRLQAARDAVTNRKQVLGDLKTFAGPPENAEAQKVHKLFREAMTLSLHADELHVQSLKATGATETSTWDDSATKPKDDLRTAFNDLARVFDVPAWPKSRRF